MVTDVLDQVQTAPAPPAQRRGPTWPQVVVACATVAAAVVLGTLYVVDRVESAHGIGGAAYHDVRLEMTSTTSPNLGDDANAPTVVVVSRGVASDVRLGESIRLYSPAAAVLTVFVDGDKGQAVCRIFVDGALARELPAGPHKPATCYWAG